MEADNILKHSNMHIKKSIYSRENSKGVIGIGNVADKVFTEDMEEERMLGDLVKYVFRFTVKVNHSPLKNKSRMGPDLSKQKLQINTPTVIKRRQYYSQIQYLFNPIRLLAPLLLRAKIMLQRAWEEECARLS